MLVFASSMLVSKAKQLFSNPFIRNAGWLGAAELLNRVFRLGTTVTLARVFSAEDYGLMSVIYTIYDFAHVLTLTGGVGAKIIQADEQDLETICETSYYLNWILCSLIFILQCVAAFPIAQFYNNEKLVLPICAAALMYLMFPVFVIQSALIERENRLKIKALCNATQAILGNLIIVIFVLLGMGVWAIVWSMVLSTPVWIFISLSHHQWRPPRFLKTSHLKRWREITSFGGSMLMVELLNRLRSNLDYLIVGRFLGLRELGFYYFAFNAGSGVTISVVNTFMNALFPHLCNVRGNAHVLKLEFLKSLKMTGLVVVPLILLQSTLAPFYVPIIFGKKWDVAIPVLIIICLSVIPRSLKWADFILLNAVNKIQLTLRFDIFYTLIFAASLLLTVKLGIFWVAVAVFSSHLVMSLLFHVLTLKSAFKT
jgi:O-antigen/teichoic acid export membrane protein